ncbi:thermostable alpha-amylase, partial [Auricularia subglabra TFB-10046 SS5]
LQFFEWNSIGPEPGVSWWSYFGRELENLAELGLTQVWLPPPNKGMNKDGRGYDAYDLWDLGEFDQKGTTRTRWGSKEELLRASSIAADLGINILIDAVLNHKLGADRPEAVKAVPVSPQDRRRAIGRPREIEAHRSPHKAWTGFDFSGRGSQYSPLKWTSDHFNGVDYDGKKTGIFRFCDKQWSKYVDNELGNYDYLLGINIDHTNPEVREDLLAWGPWVLQTTGARGFRLDAVKHFDYVTKCRSSVGSDIFAVGEYWSSLASKLEDKLHLFEGTLALFDVPLHYNFHTASNRGSAFDLRTILRHTLVERCPFDAVTFVDNHDTQPGQMLESWVGSRFKLIAYALILLRPAGLPCVFYGDLYSDGRNYDPRVAATLRKLMLARKHHAYGPVKDFFTSRNCIGFIREGDERREGCVVVLCNDPKRRAT